MRESRSSRRQFLKSGAVSGAALLGLGEIPLPRWLGPVSAEEARLPAGIVRLQPEIEPLVRLLEETPRERILEEVGSRVRRGLSYREVLAALMLAGVRNIRPGPRVGFKLHGVLVVSSAHLASLASPPEDRWLPIFWALDYFKENQHRDEREGDWTMPALDDSALPPPHRAAASFDEAMASWDKEAADRSVAAWIRGARLDEVYEALWRYGARDYRDIGHKAIYVANSYRTLQAIGAEHAEPVLRSLARALTVYHGSHPATSDQRADRPWRDNREKLRALGPGWQDGRDDPAATTDLLATLRAGTSADASAKAVELLNGGISARAVWESLFAAASELVLRRPSILSLHAQTTTNAMCFAYRTTRNDETRRLLLLQNASFLAYFTADTMSQSGWFRHRDRLDGARIDTLAAAPSEAVPSIEEVFAELGRDRGAASRKLLASLEGGTDPEAVVQAARTLVFLKGDNSHDYKFSSAILEDYAHLSPPWRHRFLAANLSLLLSSSAADNPLTVRTRQAFLA